jgi:hypothetical protein
MSADRVHEDILIVKRKGKEVSEDVWNDGRALSCDACNRPEEAGKHDDVDHNDLF